MKRKITLNSVIPTSLAVFPAILIVYVAVAWFAFEWRNPLCNESAFFRHFPSVVTFKKLPEYQRSSFKD